jgi:putative endonuclease
MYYVYVIKNECDRCYYGFTSDLRKRFLQHNSGLSRSTKGHRWELAYYEAYLSKSDALMREKRLKKFGQAIHHLRKRIVHSLGEC